MGAHKSTKNARIKRRRRLKNERTQNAAARSNAQQKR